METSHCHHQSKPSQPTKQTFDKPPKHPTDLHQVDRLLQLRPGVLQLPRLGQHAAQDRVAARRVGVRAAELAPEELERVAQQRLRAAEGALNGGVDGVGRGYWG
jgi:hypothetical protein